MALKRQRDPELASVDQIVKKRLRLEKTKQIQHENRQKNVQKKRKQLTKQKGKK
jgi:hypothetical protein